MEKKYVITFFSAAIVSFIAVFAFVTWINSWRITDAPWSIDFVSDRNMALKKFLLLKDNTNYTDLIVGSSTGEVFLTESIKKHHGIQVQQGTIGGAKSPFKLAEINYAIKNNPNLKHIIYIVDFFEFANSDLESNVYYQKDIMNEVDQDIRDQLKRPDWISRAQDYFSEAALKSASQTLRDYKKFKAGKHESQFNADGSTVKTMIDHSNNDDLEDLTMRLAFRHRHLYDGMTGPDPITVQIFQRIVEKAKAHNIKVTFVLAPMRAKFYDYFENYLKDKDRLYKEWIATVKSLESDSVRVLDYSYPVYLDKGIPDNKEYWHDGIHFGFKAAEKITDEIYRGKTP